MSKDYDFLIVGAGLFGSVLARKIAESKKKKRVLIIDKRNHVGGTCYSSEDRETGIEYHHYGIHIFNTSDKEVWKFINRFTDFNGYRHQVLSEYKGKVYQLPINLETINSFFNQTLKPYEVESFMKEKIKKDRADFKNPKNFEEMAMSRMGKELYEIFFKNYTIKQWDKDPKDLPAEIATRLPFRYNYDENYYYTSYQGMPKDGYGKLFHRLLDHDNIEIKTNTDYFKNREALNQKADQVVFTGCIDQFFDYKYGKLEYRGLKFEKEIKPYNDFIGNSVMNYPSLDIPYTRIQEPKHFHPEREYIKDKTLILKEYSIKSTGEEDPYYPINDSKNNSIYQKYEEESKRLLNTHFCGRLGRYKYINMDVTIRDSLSFFNNIK